MFEIRDAVDCSNWISGVERSRFALAIGSMASWRVVVVAEMSLKMISKFPLSQRR
jgi:hypothetical protein